VHLQDGAVSAPRRRRGQALEDQLLDTAWDVLVESGYSGFTYEAIAARAGTSRPVLYRRWPKRDDLVMATLQRYFATHAVEVPDTGDLRADALALLRDLNRMRAPIITVLNVQLQDWYRQSGTTLGELRQRLLAAGYRSPLTTLVDRAVERGQLPDVPRSLRLVKLPFDLVRQELILTNEPVPDDQLVEIVDEIWLPLLRRG
jgi:AcrR family transcriptional regulator